MTKEVKELQEAIDRYDNIVFFGGSVVSKIGRATCRERVWLMV